jgi:hypothetical protein
MPVPRDIYQAVPYQYRSVGMAPSSGIKGWSAGGGGSRERLQEMQNLTETIPAVSEPPMTMEDMVNKYWIYGAAAIVGLMVVQRL